MRISDYVRAGVDIRTLPVSQLRSIDIETVDEEKLVAQILAEKAERFPQKTNVFIGDIKARMDRDITNRKEPFTREKELAYQKEVDERVAKSTGQPAEGMVSAPVESDIKIEESETKSAEPIETLEKKIRKLKKK